MDEMITTMGDDSPNRATATPDATSDDQALEDLLAVLTAARDGDFGARLPARRRDLVGEVELRTNELLAMNARMARELERVSRIIGREGRMTERVSLGTVEGSWTTAVDSVNAMIDELVRPTTEISRVIAAVAQGDLTQKMALTIQGQPVKGEFSAIGTTVNEMVDQLSSFADEVTRVAREVGTEGQLGGQAEVQGVSGTWRDLTESVNVMASNLTDQVRQIAAVTTAVAQGDLTQKVTVEAKGEVATLAETINSMTDRLRVFAEQVTGVAREVGTEGRLGGQAEVEGVSGTWRDLTDGVNLMANNLTEQVRNIAQVTTAVAYGDLSQKITVDARGEIAELKQTINTMVDQLSSFADEVTRVAREVGTEGRLGGQAEVKGVSGTWRDLTESVNQLADNLTDQVRNIAQVTTAVAGGDLSKKIDVEAQGEIAELKQTINTMVDQLSSFADEVTRVAREVGTEGRLGGQAEVKGVSGTWRDLTESVNQLADNLTDQVRNIAQVTTAVANGDLSQTITVDAQGEIAELKGTINTMVDQLGAFAAEVTRVAREVGTEGKLGGQATVEGVSGTWRGLTDNVNLMAGNLTSQVRSIARVTTAVAGGDLSKKIDIEAQGEILELSETINTMVDQLSSFADEVTRVAREVGTDGKLGGQARVKGVSGTWRDLTESVNVMASNLTDQVRNIAQVATAVAGGDLSQKIDVDARGEILELKRTLNTMVDQLGAFADEVTRVAREVGTDGVLGGQAEVEGVSGTWRDLTENVNQLAGNLTEQVRAIAEVSTAVTQGDLTRHISVEAKGEVAELSDTINQMIANLRETTDKNAGQDWLNTNLTRISGLMQGQRDLATVSRLIMSEVSPLVSAQHGAFFLAEWRAADVHRLRLIASYGYKRRKSVPDQFAMGEGLVGQAALERKSIFLTDVPDDYVKVSSGLGEATPVNLVVMPILFEEQVMAVIELASVREFSDVNQAFLEQLAETLGVVLNAIIANRLTEELLEQSQSLTEELQVRSHELQRTNEELQEKAELLSRQNRDIEVQNAEIQRARESLEEKASQLALSSRFKSEFLANMSHELRTPLNSLLILSKLLAQNPDHNLTDEQIKFASAIHTAGADLLSLISDILDLSKIEAGKMNASPSDVELAGLRDYVDRAFSSIAEQKGLEFAIDFAEDAPATIVTDEQRLQQVVRNLLSNAFKFTTSGRVALEFAGTGEAAPDGSAYALSVTVRDTGIGIAEDKLRLIFEAFQQADGTTSRRFGGTGLGLSISREIASILGGEIRVHSVVGEGSAFTLLLPTSVDAPLAGREDGGVAPVEGGRAAAPPRIDEGTAAANGEPLGTDAVLEGKRVLIVDDDVRNVFALTSALEARGIQVRFAGDGREAIQTLDADTAVDLVLMDVMMPEMDGHETTRALRADERFADLPIIALTAKAMKGDREKSIGAGASDYITKPVDTEQLVSLMRVWLTR